MASIGLSMRKIASGNAWQATNASNLKSRARMQTESYFLRLPARVLPFFKLSSHEKSPC